MRVLEHGNVPRCIAYSPDGATMAVGDEAAISLYSLPGLERVAYLCVKGKAVSVEALAFSPDGKYLAAGMASGIHVWKLSTPDEPFWAEGHRGGTRGLVWLAERGGWLFSAGWDNFLRGWSYAPHFAKTFVPSQEPTATPEPITCLTLRSDGEEMAGGGRGSLHFWLWHAGMRQWRRRTSFAVAQPIHAVASTRDGNLVAAGHADGRISLWHFWQRDQVGELVGHDWVVYGLAFTPDGSRLVSGGADGTVRLWDVPHRRAIETYRWHKSWVTCVGVAPDGMTAATGSDDYDVVWDLADA